MYSLILLRPGSLHLRPLRHSSPPSFSASTAATYLDPAILIPACTHHCIPTHTPGEISVPSQRPISDSVAMYCATVFCCRRMYSSIVWNPASSLAVVAKVYLHFPSGFRRWIFPVSRLSNWSWKLLMGPSHVGGDHPGLRAEEQHRLQHGFKEEAVHPHLRPLTAEDSCHPLPHCPCSWQVTDHFRPVVVRCQDHLYQISEGGHHLQGAPIGAECPGGDLPLLLYCQSTSIPLRSPFALLCAPVYHVKQPPRHQHVKQRAPWVG